MRNEFLETYQCKGCNSTWYKGDLSGGLCEECQTRRNDPRWRVGEEKTPLGIHKRPSDGKTCVYMAHVICNKCGWGEHMGYIK